MDDNQKDRQEDVGASACPIPNGQNPRPHFQAFYGEAFMPKVPGKQDAK